MTYFEYSEVEVNYLKRKCKKLGAAIDRIGFIQRNTNPNVFEALVESIVAQQISSKAAKTVWERIRLLLTNVTAENIINANPTELQKCGMSVKKTEYITGIAHAALSGTVDFENLNRLSDEEIIKQLSSLKGVGVWTAEMLLIFSLQRKNILSYGDLAIKRGLMNLYGLKSINKLQFEKYRKRFSPYNTIASLYLWSISVE